MNVSLGLSRDLGNRCGLHSGPSSIGCRRSPNCVRGEREGPRPFCLNRGDAGPSTR
ncbi:hypothetical protein GBA52_008572 [Prunus armeniaca]|nr:hypothetical protein GBA52_008572 [Prunus armeniaca]